MGFHASLMVCCRSIKTWSSNMLTTIFFLFKMYWTYANSVELGGRGNAIKVRHYITAQIESCLESKLEHFEHTFKS